MARYSITGIAGFKRHAHPFSKGKTLKETWADGTEARQVPLFHLKMDGRQNKKQLRAWTLGNCSKGRIHRLRFQSAYPVNSNPGKDYV